MAKFGARRDKEQFGMVTHLLVGENPDKVSIEEAEEILEVPVVHYKWVIYSVKCGKLLPTKALAVCDKILFKNVVATTSGVGLDDVKKIWTMLTYQGGTFLPRLDLNRCTHVICGKPSGVCIWLPF